MAFSSKQNKFLHASGGSKVGLKKSISKAPAGFPLPKTIQAPPEDNVISPDKKFKMLRAKLKGY